MRSTFLGFILSVPLFLFGQTDTDYLTALQTRDWAAAIEAKKAQTSTNVSNAAAWFELADAQLAAGQVDAARQTLAAALNASGDEEWQELARGRQALLDGRADAAADHFKRAAKKGRRTDGLHRLIGTAYLYGPKPDARTAANWLEEARNRDGNDYATLLTLALAYTDLTDGGQTLATYQEAARIQPKATLPVYMTAKTYQKAKLPERYVEWLQKTVAVDPTFEPGLRDLAAYHFYTSRDYAAAADAYGQLVQRVPTATIDDKMQYANSLFLARRYPETIEWVERIIAEDGSRNYLRRLAGYASYETGEIEKGLGILQDYFTRVDSTKIIPQDYEYYGRLLQKSGQDSLALIQYQLAVGMDSTRWELYDAIGQLLYDQRQFEAAVAAYRLRLDSLATPTAMDWYRVGVAEFMRQDSAAYERAVLDFAHVTELAPTALIGWWMQARTLAKLEPDVVANPASAATFGRARPAFDRYVELAAADVEKNKANLITAYEYLAYYHFVHRDAAAADAALDKLVELDPNNATARELRKALEANDLSGR